MENFQDAVAAIIKALPAWEKTSLNAVQKSLNEAQTCQVVILRLLDAAGYDIWNPFEVLPQRSQDGSIPDFTIAIMGIDKFVIEVKALDIMLSRISRVQAITYVNTKGLRWAILTNGKQWEFLDNGMKDKEVEVEAADRIALVLNLLEPRAGEFLSTLLDRRLWEKEGANERVAKQVQLIRIAMEVSKMLHIKKGIKHDHEGVEIAIDYLPPTEDKDVAKKNLPQIVELLFPQNPPLVEIQAAPITQIMPQATAKSLNVWQVLYEQLEAAQQKSRTDISKMKDFYTIRFNEYQINISSMGNLCEAFGETCLKLKLSEALKLISEQDRNPAMAYRLLSNQQYISVNYSFDAGMAFVKKLLKTLGLPAGSVTISSNNKGIHVLP